MRQGWSVSLTVLDGTLHELSGDGCRDVRSGSLFAGRIFTIYLAAHRRNRPSMAVAQSGCHALVWMARRIGAYAF